MSIFFGKVLSKEQLVNDISSLKKKSKKIVFTNGCFDILHPGHVSYLAEARSLGDILVVGLDTDESVRKLKGESRPIQNQEARAKVLTSLRSVDYVCFFGEGNPEPLIEAIAPDVLVKGGDWQSDQIVGSQIVLGDGGMVKSLAFVDGYSTTSLIEKIWNLR